MVNRFGGIPVKEEQHQVNRFGGVPVEEQPGTVLNDAVDTQQTSAKKKEVSPRKKELTVELRQRMANEAIADIWPTTAFAISIGKGVENVAKGLGMVGEPSEQSQYGMAALEKEFPIATTAGEVTGEAAPFLLPGAKIGQLGVQSARVVGGGLLGAAEGGILSEDTTKGAGIGGAIGAGAEMLFPVIGRLGKSLWRRWKGVEPPGLLLDNAGQPTQEFQQVLDESGIDFEDLSEDATQMISAQAGRDPSQVATAARFKDAGIPITKGELTKDTAQRTRENQLFETGQEGSEELRQFKLKQSEAIKEHLDSAFGADVTAGETGELIQNALTGRETMLRTRKNDFYKELAEMTEDGNSVPIILDSIADAIPDDRTLRSLSRASKGTTDDVMDTLAEFGIIEPTENMVKRGLEPEILSLRNFDDFEQSLNMLQRADPSGATGVLVKPIREALGLELDEMAIVLDDIVGKDGVDVVSKKAAQKAKVSIPNLKEIRDTLGKARATVKKMKTEFNPKSIVGKLTDFAKNSDVPLVAATQVYSKLAARSMPVENVNRVMKSLAKAEGGDAAIASLQASTMMDLMDAGFGTNSRQIDGILTFNPTAFKKRVKALGQDKLASIFGNNKEAFRKIRNIDKIAMDLIPPATTVPKGSAAVNLQIAQDLGLASLFSKFPGVGPIVVGAMKKVAQPIKVGREVQRAINAEPDVVKLTNMLKDFPNLTRAFGIAAMTDKETE